MTTLIVKIREDGFRPQKKSTAYYEMVTAELTLSDVLFVSNILDADIKMLLMQQIDSMSNWDELDVDGDLTTEQHAVSQIRAGNAVACIVAVPYRGIIDTEHGELHMLAVPEDTLAFYRALPEALDFDETSLIANAFRAYPYLIFCPNIESQIRSFSRPYAHMRAILTKALAELNDRLPPLLNGGLPLPEVKQHFTALSGFEISPESPNTRKNKNAMAERDVVFAGHTFCCEWHLKIEPHRDRIHFHLPHSKIGNGRQILIGIFCNHLTT